MHAYMLDGEKTTDNIILQELDIKRELLGHVRKRKLSYFGHLCRDHSCQITKTEVEVSGDGRRIRGRPRKQYIDNIKQWTQLQCNNITVRTGGRRSQPLETTRQSSDGDQRSHMICRKEKVLLTINFVIIPSFYALLLRELSHEQKNTTNISIVP